MTLRYAARGEVYDSEAGPVEPAGLGVGGHTARANKDSGLPSVRSPLHSLSTGPTHRIFLPHASLLAS